MNTIGNNYALHQPTLMKKSKESLSGNWGVAIGAFVLVSLVSGMSNIIPGGAILIGGPLSLGMAVFSIRLAKNVDVEIGDAFSGFNDFVDALVAYLLMVLIIGVGFVLLIVPGIILAYGLSQTMYILADDTEIKPTDALRKSWEMMKGHKFDLFILGLRFIPWVLLCILTLGIGFLWLAPWMGVTMANFYLALKGDDEENDDFVSDHLVDDNL